MDEKHHAAEEQGRQEELEQLIAFLQTHGKALGIGLAVVAVVIAASGLYRHRLRQNREQAAVLLMEARTARDLEDLVQRHDSAPVTPVALLKLAKAYFNAGNYDVALTKYEEFGGKYAEHPLAAASELGAAHCLEARAQVSEALDAMERFIAERPRHFLLPQAVLGKARCLLQLGRVAQARTCLEKFIAARGESGWVARAEELLADIDRVADVHSPPPGGDAPVVIVTNREDAAATAVPGGTPTVEVGGPAD